MTEPANRLSMWLGDSMCVVASQACALIAWSSRRAQVPEGCVRSVATTLPCEDRRDWLGARAEDGVCVSTRHRL